MKRVWLAGCCAALFCGCGLREGPTGSGTIECTQVLVAPVAFAWPLTVRFVHEMVNRDKFKNGQR